MDQLLHISAILFLICSLTLWIYSFYRARRIVKYFQHHHTAAWIQMGSPKPDYLSPLVNREWKILLTERKYLALQDDRLSAMCQAQQRLEKSSLAVTLTFFAVVGGISYWYSTL